jgi:hypothetical protein
MQTSENIDKIAAALVASQGQSVAKTSTNPHFRSKYADLSACIEASAEALKANGLAVVTVPCGGTKDMLEVSSLLAHSSGQWMRTQFAVPLPKSDPQGFGSALTYARRYCLAAWCQLVQEDDDGNAASTAPRAPARTLPAATAQPTAPSKPSAAKGKDGPVDMAQVELLELLVSTAETTDALTKLGADVRKLPEPHRSRLADLGKKRWEELDR